MKQINIDYVVEKANAIMYATEKFDVKQELSQGRIITVVPHIKVHVKLIRLIFESFKSINTGLSAELIIIQLSVLKKALHGDNGKYHSIKKSLERIFNHRHFDQNPILKKMTAKFFVIIINLMADEIDIDDSLVNKNTNWEENVLKYFDKKYIVSELLEVPLKYQ